ncbi:MAG: CBS domain-containing protein [Anaerolineales bacterium]
MHIILTHERADFDALASLLAAHLLNDSAVPVLPRRMNRNVRAFLTLYGIELPFTDPRDLNGEPIEAVTLVDTQSMVSIKGMVDKPQVNVIDHHPRRENLPKDWVVTIVEIGATTTLLIEALQERNGIVAPIQATLLLLGIYEDTGSLTYTRTTPRDIRAAAYLLEQGASLKIAGDFLNHPLSPQQQKLYEHLRDSAQHYHINGHTIVVATGDATDQEEELSSIAHKLRDLLDPDALFLLFETGGGVQLIARSTSDNIDVSDVAETFGGGGHERAAAGLIRDREIKNIHAELVRILPEHVKPAVTVAQIMSRGPQLLSIDTPVEEAAQKMRRYGYEGYPVVKDDKVVGLLTRRAVDRAISHKLNLNAGSLMKAGEFTAQPGDSVEVLQDLMTDSGWGQIPVVDPESNKIIGIVTRTDLLKTLTSHARIPGRHKVSGRLEAALPAQRLALIKAIAQAAHQQQAALYVVGGFVRDLLLERPSIDFDLVVEGDAISLARFLAKQYGGRVTTHSKFGTAKWLLPQESDIHTLSDDIKMKFPIPGLKFVDLVSARTEFYTYPTALPTVERGSIKLDLHRRDFTINTLAIRLDGRHYGELHDYWGGLNDLRHGLVCVLHSLSFVDDPTRMLRAVRFEQRFDFRIEQRTLELLHAALPLLEKVSGDRIRHELDHILVEPKAAKILARLDDLNLLVAIHPLLKWDEWLKSRLEELSAEVPDRNWDLKERGDRKDYKKDLGYCLWLLRLPAPEVKKVSKRLKLPSGLTKAILAGSELWRDLPGLIDEKPSGVVKWLQDLPPLSIYAVYQATSDIRLRKLLQTYAFKWKKITPTIDGHDLRERGLPPGPIYRHVLGRLREAWLDGEITNQEEEQAFLQHLLEEAIQEN